MGNSDSGVSFMLVLVKIFVDLIDMNKYDRIAPHP
jgi:hypothetical protein